MNWRARCGELQEQSLSPVMHNAPPLNRQHGGRLTGATQSSKAIRGTGVLYPPCTHASVETKGRRASIPYLAADVANALQRAGTKLQVVQSEIAWGTPPKPYQLYSGHGGLKLPASPLPVCRQTHGIGA